MERSENFGLLRIFCAGRTFEVRERTIDGEWSKLDSERLTTAWDHLISPPQPILWCIGSFKYSIYAPGLHFSHLTAVKTLVS